MIKITPKCFIRWIPGFYINCDNEIDSQGCDEMLELSGIINNGMGLATSIFILTLYESRS
jgi:hypothetical protein